jgi:hypothetical protein
VTVTWPAPPTAAATISGTEESVTPSGTNTTGSVTGSGGGSLADPAPHWDGDFWVSASGYRVARKWVDKYPALYGPLSQDPDEGQGEVECNDLIAQLLAKFTGYGGTFSTWTERHGFIIFGGIGYNDVTCSADVPPIPEWALKEMAYCYTGLSMGRAAKKLEEAAPSLKTYIGIFTAGGVSVGAILKFILPLVGIAV